MALLHPVLGLPIQCRTFRDGELPVRRRLLAGVVSLAERRLLRDPASEAKPRHGPTEIAGQGKLKVKVVDVPALDSRQIRGEVEIPVTCFQLLGVTMQAEKDEIVKAVNDLKSSTIEEGYTIDTIAFRQELLMDVRDKLLFEPEYAGNIKDKMPPKSSLKIPWPWLPGALCILQEVGEEKLVLDIGRAALQLPSAKAYSHDLLLAMALAECSIAKVGFEKNKVSEGFEALARAQHLLRSNVSLAKMSLLPQIEESLEDLAPACTLELLSLPNAPDSAERRRGALAALQELIRQGLDVEPSCRVEDWSYFLILAMKKLTATEVVDLLSWETLAVTRKNKKSIESQNQRVVLDFNCFYLAMIAHIALGFSTRQNEMIARAKNICECLIISEGADLKLEEVFCSFLLGKHGGMEDFEKLRQLVATRNSTTQNPSSSMSGMDKNKDKGDANHALETWLKEAVLRLFPDTRDCSPSLANFFGSSKRILSVGSQKILSKKAVPVVGHSISSFGILPDRGTCGQAALVRSSNHLGEAVKQLAAVNLQSENEVAKVIDNPSLPCSQPKRNLDSHHKRPWERWFGEGDMAGTIAYTTLVGCFLLVSFKLLHSMQFGHPKTAHPFRSSHSRVTREADSASYTASRHISGSLDRDVMDQLRKFWVILKQNLGHKNSHGSLQKPWPTEDLSTLHSAADTLIHKAQMATEEAAALVMHWQDVKAEALGPEHQIQLLPSILSESMLIKWQDLANSAKARSCFWRFVLIQASIVRAEIVSDGGDSEMAEIEALLEEAAELVDESERNNRSYYSTYKVHYILRRQEDGSWRICRGSIQNQT